MKVFFNAESNERYFLEVDVQYPENLNNLHNDLPFLSERMKIEKVLKNLHDKNKYTKEIINKRHIRKIKQALNHELVLKRVHRVIKFNQKTWLKLNVDMNTDLRKKAKSKFEKDFFELMNKAVFGKTTENVRKHRDIKLVTN